MESLAKLIKKHKIVEHQALITSLASPAISWRPQKISQADLRPTDSRLGGSPHLPKSLKWPTHDDVPMAFLASLNCAEIPAIEGDAKLPSSGMLHFWFPGWDAAADTDAISKVACVIHDQSPVSKLALRPVPSAVAEYARPAGARRDGTFTPCKVTPHAAVTLDVSGVYYRAWAHRKNPLPDSVLTADNRFENLDTELRAMERTAYQSLGFAHSVQNPWDVEACDRLGGKRAAKTKPEDLVLLLQLASERLPGWNWGDAGSLYFGISKDALKRGNFAAAFVVCQCS